MTLFISRYTRLTSLVGTLLTAAVAGCLVAFSLVAQRSALQSPGAPEVRPVTPIEGVGAPIDLGPLAVGAPDEPRDGAEPSSAPSAGDEIDALLAVADTLGEDVDDPIDPGATADPGPPSEQGRSVGPGGPRPALPDEGPDDPLRCQPGRCRDDVERPSAGASVAEAPGKSACRGKGHLKPRSNHGHGEGKGKGHCKHGARGHDPSDGSSAPGRSGSTPAPEKRGSSGGSDKSRPEKDSHPSDRGSNKGSRPDPPGKSGTPPGHEKRDKGNPGGGHGKPDNPGGGHGQGKPDDPGGGNGNSNKGNPGRGHGRGKGK